jgi:hypothetical protein
VGSLPRKLGDSGQLDLFVGQTTLPGVTTRTSLETRLEFWSYKISALTPNLMAQNDWKTVQGGGLVIFDAPSNRSQTALRHEYGRTPGTARKELVILFPF